MPDLKSTGICIFCQQSYDKRGISRHLETHLKKLDPVAKKKSFHLRVDAGPYFLNLLMDGDARLSALDHFLRAIWLECCGHMSQFSHGRWTGEQLGLNQLSNKVFDKGVKLWYAYDFGSTTELDIKCISVHPVATKEGIRLLSRNEPLLTPCDRCSERQAVSLCTAHYGDEEVFFCEECAEVHMEECADAADYAMMPIVNSPRMGVCGYTGGNIDLERDRVSA